MQSALERWQELIDARAQQMDAIYASMQRSSADYWDRRARGFHRATRDSIASDPLYQRLAANVDARTHVLDIGAGTGRFSLALSELAERVTAVEPNATMLSFLRRDAEQHQRDNITYVESTWEEAPDDLRADLVICSHVLYPLRDIEHFLSKVLRATRGSCYIYMRARHFDEITAPLWQHFHRTARCLPPAYIHALDVLYEMGVYANVEMVNVAQSLRYPTLESAVQELSEQLLLPTDEGTQEELSALLHVWLVEREGMLQAPQDAMQCAILRIDQES